MRGEVAKFLDHDPHFVWRGQSVSRIENLSDIVFALALGMLLLTGTPPQTYSELVHFLISIVPVAGCFAILVMIWNAHFVFFRRYALADNTIVLINSALLLFVLFVAYPLRFIFDSFYWYVISSITGDFSQLIATEMDMANSARSMAFFGAGYAVVFTLLSFMYAHAIRKAELIGLSATEIRLTKHSIWSFRVQVLVAIAVVLGALYTPMGPFSGSLMFLNWPLSFMSDRIINQRESKASAEGETGR